MHPVASLALAVPLALAACAAPQPAGGPASVTAAGASPSGARVCRVEGLHFTRETIISPTMTVSRNGSCSNYVRTNGNGNDRSLSIRSRPAHGTLSLDLSNPTRPSYRYTPARDYVGSDSFSMVYTSRTGVQIDMSVDVVP